VWPAGDEGGLDRYPVLVAGSGWPAHRAARKSAPSALPASRYTSQV
jgi:hypothetical protein